MCILGQRRKRLRSLEENLVKPNPAHSFRIAALVLSLAIDFYPDPFKVSWGKSSRFAFDEENGAFPGGKTWKKSTQHFSVEPSIFDGLKPSRYVVSLEPSELMFWMLTAEKMNWFN